MADKPATISLDEGMTAPEAQPAPAAPAEQPAPKKQKPLNPKPSDLPPDAEPAMEKVTQPAPAAESQAPEAGASALAQQVAPVAEDTGTSETDPILEELRKSRKDVSIDDAADESDVDLETNQIEVGPPRGDELVNLFMQMYPTKQLYDAAKADPESILSRTIAATDHGWGTTQARDIIEVLKTNDTYKKLHTQQDSLRFPGIKDGRPNRVSMPNADIAGRDAIIALKARLGGIVRVNLLNSGFWVAIRSPQIDELQEIFASIDFENREIGRILGGHFALVTDMYLKDKFVNILVQKQIIMESNFKDIYKPGAFARNLAYHDYDTLMHAVVMLMTRGGLRYRCVCPKCGNMSVENLDVGACKFVNEDLWTDEVRKWWNTTVDKEGKLIVHTEKDLLNYRNNILGKKHIFTNKVDNGLGETVEISLELTEPTMRKYQEVGSILIRKLNETIDAISKGNEDKAELVTATLAVHNYQQVAPWVNLLRVTGEDGKVDIQTSDVNVILTYLDELSQHDGALTKALTEFIAESRFNWIGTHAIQCPNPNCKARPSQEMDGFYPLEIQTIFFGLSSRLWRSGR